MNFTNFIMKWHCFCEYDAICREVDNFNWELKIIFLAYITDMLNSFKMCLHGEIKMITEI